MQLTAVQKLIIMLCIAAGTALTRFLPFWLFPEGRRQPKLISYLSETIPAAMMGLLLVYCLRAPQSAARPYLPEAIALAVTIALQLWKRNVLLSIAVGTVLNMVLVQFVFV